MKQRLRWLVAAVMGGVTGLFATPIVRHEYGAIFGLYARMRPTPWTLGRWDASDPTEFLWFAIVSTVAAAALWLRLRIWTSRSMWPTVTSSAVAGWLCAPLCYAGMLLIGDHSPHRSVVADIVLAGALGAPIGGTLGAAFGLLTALPVFYVRAAADTPSHVAIDRALSAFGLYVTILGCVAMLLVPGAGSFPPYAQGDFASAAAGTIPIPTGLLAALAGVGLATLGGLRELIRSRWLARVKDQRVAGWKILSASNEALDTLVPFLAHAPWTTTDMLVREEPLPAQGAYRTGPDAFTPWALVKPDPPRRSIPD